MPDVSGCQKATYDSTRTKIIIEYHSADPGDCSDEPNLGYSKMFKCGTCIRDLFSLKFECPERPHGIPQRPHEDSEREAAPEPSPKPSTPDM